MRSFLPAVVCALSLCTASARAQIANIQPLRVTAGTVLTFYSQTRLHPAAGNALDGLQKGTELKVKLLESIDSNVDRDGFEFHGLLMAPLAARGEVLVHSRAVVHGLLVLLRSRNHPEGFRYELLVTSIRETGKSYELTASLNPSFADTAGPYAEVALPSTSDNAKEQGRAAKLPANNN